MTGAVAAEKLSAYALMEDATLARAMAELERRLDRLDDATWPNASRERIDALDRLDQARAEMERRRV